MPCQDTESLASEPSIAQEGRAGPGPGSAEPNLPQGVVQHGAGQGGGTEFGARRLQGCEPAGVWGCWQQTRLWQSCLKGAEERQGRKARPVPAPQSTCKVLASLGGEGWGRQSTTLLLWQGHNSLAPPCAGRGIVIAIRSRGDGTSAQTPRTLLRSGLALLWRPTGDAASHGAPAVLLLHRPSSPGCCCQRRCWHGEELCGLQPVKKPKRAHCSCPGSREREVGQRGLPKWKNTEPAAGRGALGKGPAAPRNPAGALNNGNQARPRPAPLSEGQAGG